MKGILGPLNMIPKFFRNVLLAPAQDPWEVHGTVYQGQQRLPERTRLDLERSREALGRGFSRLNSDVGLKVLHDMASEYEQLRPVLDSRRETDPLSVAHIPALVEETYRQGLSVLEDALELTQSIHLPDVQRLEAEVVRLEREIQSLRGDETQGARVKMREETMASHKELLDMIKQQQLRVDELLHQSDRCQASLHWTRIELAALRADSSGTSVTAVTETLRRTIDQARGVQEEMKRLGF